jgi:hypothetical protein
VNAERTKYIFMSNKNNAGQNYKIKTATKSFENVAKFIGLRTTLTNKNRMHEKIKSILNSGNAWYYTVQNLLSSHFLSKTMKIKIYITIVVTCFIRVLKLSSHIKGKNVGSECPKAR